MNSRDIEPYWLDEKDWLCSIEFLPPDDEETRAYAAETIGYLFGYAHLTDTRMLALIGDPREHAYELLFSFSSPGNKARFLELIVSNEDLGDHYLREDLIIPTETEIRQARPLKMVLPEDIFKHVELIATTIAAGSESDRPSS